MPVLSIIWEIKAKELAAEEFVQGDADRVIEVQGIHEIRLGNLDGFSNLKEGFGESRRFVSKHQGERGILLFDVW